MEMKISKSEAAELLLGGGIIRPGQSQDWPMEAIGKFARVRLDLVRTSSGLVDGHYECAYEISRSADQAICALEALLSPKVKDELREHLASIADTGR